MSRVEITCSCVHPQRANQAEQHVLPPVCGLVFLPKNFILGINIFCYHSLDRSRHITGTLDADQDNIFLQSSIRSRANLGVVPLWWECDPALIWDSTTWYALQVWDKQRKWPGLLYGRGTWQHPSSLSKLVKKWRLWSSNYDAIPNSLLNPCKWGNVRSDFQNITWRNGNMSHINGNVSATHQYICICTFLGEIPHWPFYSACCITLTTYLYDLTFWFPDLQTRRLGASDHSSGQGFNICKCDTTGSFWRGLQKSSSHVCGNRKSVVFDQKLGHLQWSLQWQNQLFFLIHTYLFSCLGWKGIQFCYV